MPTIKKGTYRFNPLLDSCGFTNTINENIEFYNTLIWTITEEDLPIIKEEFGIEIPAGVYKVKRKCGGFRLQFAADNRYRNWVKYLNLNLVSVDPYCEAFEKFFGEVQDVDIVYDSWAYPYDYYTEVDGNEYWGATIEQGGNIITITQDQDVTDEFYTWFTANAKHSPVIKAGTYKFNDVLTMPIEYNQTFNQEVTFTVSTMAFGYGVVISCYMIHVDTDGMSYHYNSVTPDLGEELPSSRWVYTDDWNTDYSEGIKTITITEDTAVSAEFAEWFTENAVEQKQISGKWRFNQVPNIIDKNTEQAVKFSTNYEKHTAFCSKVKVWNNTNEPPNAVHIDVLVDTIDGQPTGNESYSIIVENSIFVFGYGKGSEIWNFGTEPQYVSIDFYNWFTNNANKILEIKMKDLFFNYNESQAQVGYKSAVLYKKQGDTKYRFLCASESVPFPYGTKDTFEYDLLNSSSKGLAEGKNTLEQKEVELLYTPNNAYLFEQLKGQVLDFMSLTPDKIGYKYHGTISFRPNDATADIHRGTYTITPMGASEVPYFMARKECYVPLFFADVIPYEISIAELGNAESVALNLGLVGNYKEAVYKYDTFSETTNRFSGTSNEITVTNGIGTIPKNAGLYLITAEPKETDKTTHSGCFTLVYITD